MKPTVIILEGPDGSGKSSLAKDLVRLTGYAAVHLGAPVDETAYEQCAGELHRTFERGPQGIIFDRFHLSEMIYGPIFRGVDSLGAHGAAMLERTLWLDTKPIVVLCLPPYEVAQRNWSERARSGSEMLRLKSHFDDVYDGYCCVWRYTSLPILHYDYTSRAPENLHDALRFMDLAP